MLTRGRSLAFRLTITVGVGAVGAALCWFAILFWQKQAERLLVAEIKQSGGQVFYDYQCNEMGWAVLANRDPTGPAWARRILGDDFFSHPASVAYSPDSPAALPAALGQLRTIRDIDVDGVCAASKPFMAISSLPLLTSIELSGEFDSHDLAGIAPMPSVRLIDFDRMPISDAVCRLIVDKFPGLSHIYLRGGLDASKEDEPSDVGLSVIRTLPHLQELLIEGSDGFSFKALADCSGLRELRWLSVPIRWDAPGEKVHLHDCPRLEKLEVSQGGAQDTRRWELFLERVPCLRELSLEYVEGFHLGGTRTLEKLKLINSDVPREAFAALAACPRLSQVDLGGYAGDTSIALDELLKFAALKTLAIGAVNEDILKQVLQFKQLEELDLAGNRNVDDRTLDRLVVLKKLRLLQVWCTGVTPDGAKRLETAIPGLRCELVTPLQGGRGLGL